MEGIIRYSEDAKPTLDQVLGLYRTVGWSSADKPQKLHAGLLGAHSLVTAWRDGSGDDDSLLIGLGSAISDGHLVVYFPHLVVRPGYQGQGVGTRLMGIMMKRYRGFHQQALLADGLPEAGLHPRGLDRAALDLRRPRA